MNRKMAIKSEIVGNLCAKVSAFGCEELIGKLSALYPDFRKKLKSEVAISVRPI